MAIKRWTRITNMEQVDAVLDVEGLMALLRISRNTALELLTSGEIPAAKAGRAWRISKEAVIRFLNGQKEAAAG